MVVSEIGEQWSPQTAPAMQAEMEGYKSSANLWYDEFRKAKDELESLKARLLALGLQGDEP